MAVFSYKAADAAGKVIKGTLEAPDERNAVSMLQNKGCIPIQIDPVEQRIAILKHGAHSDRSGISHISSLFNRVSSSDILLFTQDLCALLKAGLPVDRSLSILKDVTDNPRLSTVIDDILNSVRGGSYLSDAIARHPRIFSEFYTNMIRAGEAGGILETVLERLGMFLETSQDLKEYIKSAMVYPAFLVFVGGISIIILMVFVIPKFSVIFTDMGEAIPLSTKFLLGASQVIRSYWWLIITLLILLFFAIKKYTNTPSGRIKLDTYRLNLPILGELTRKIEVARFSRTLGTLVNSGVPILSALDLVKGIIRNQVIRGSMGMIYTRVKEGEKLSMPLADTGLFPSLAVQMITVGEESGRLAEMLLRVAENYEKNIKNTVKRLISFLEPAMILFMGVVVGFIIISMLMAIFSINEIPF